MKLLLTAALLFTASAGIAFAKGEGRYQTTEIGAPGYYVVTDTKTGKTSVCLFTDVKYKPACTPWAEIDD